MILICYDGSNDAKWAVEQSGELLGCQPATVLTVWQPFAEVLARAPVGFGLGFGAVDIDKADEASRQTAVALAEEGAELARRGRLQRPAARLHAAGHHRARDPRRGRADRRYGDRDGVARPQRAEVNAARKRVHRRPAQRGPDRDRRPLARGGGLAQPHPVRARDGAVADQPRERGRRHVQQDRVRYRRVGGSRRGGRVRSPAGWRGRRRAGDRALHGVHAARQGRRPLPRVRQRGRVAGEDRAPGQGHVRQRRAAPRSR